jgi:hypothetical protein
VDGGTDLIDFPLLVSIDLDENNVENVSGYDIIFTDINNAALDFEIESYTDADGKYLAWVRIPNLLANADTDI